MNFYKIKHNPTGLFWKGGDVPHYLSHHLSQDDSKEFIISEKFSKLGKSWSKINHVTCALTCVHTSQLKELLKNECSIETYESVCVEHTELKFVL